MRGIREIMVCRIVMLLWSFEAICISAPVNISCVFESGLSCCYDGIVRILNRVPML